MSWNTFLIPEFLDSIAEQNELEQLVSVFSLVNQEFPDEDENSQIYCDVYYDDLDAEDVEFNKITEMTIFISDDDGNATGILFKKESNSWEPIEEEIESLEFGLDLRARRRRFFFEELEEFLTFDSDTQNDEFFQWCELNEEEFEDEDLDDDDDE